MSARNRATTGQISSIAMRAERRPYRRRNPFLVGNDRPCRVRLNVRRRLIRKRADGTTDRPHSAASPDPPIIRISRPEPSRDSLSSRANASRSSTTTPSPTTSRADPIPRTPIVGDRRSGFHRPGSEQADAALARRPNLRLPRPSEPCADLHGPHCHSLIGRDRSPSP